MVLDLPKCPNCDEPMISLDDEIYFDTTDEGYVRFICRACYRAMYGQPCYVHTEQIFIQQKPDWKEVGF